MEKINLDDYKKWHFIGIGGTSMSGLAEILLSWGCEVTGSDRSKTNVTKMLERKKSVVVHYGHSKENIAAPDCVVYTAAIAKDNIELMHAKELGILSIERSALLGQIIKKYKHCTAISGTNGKTTTSAMIAQVMLESNLDPTVHIGGQLELFGGKGVHIGGKDFFVTEACEYVDSFLTIYPTVAVVLNIEYDHPDYFADVDHISKSFLEFIRHVPKEGTIVANIDDPNVRGIIGNKQLSGKVITYGLDTLNKPDWTAEDIQFDEDYCATYNLIKNQKNMGRVKLNVPGMHNVSNSIAAAAACFAAGCNMPSIIRGLREFAGVHRRFELKAEVNGVKVIDNYVCIPSTIYETLKLIKTTSKARVWCVFQPHTYTRTKSLLKEFAKAFEYADHIVLLDIYAAREKDVYQIHSKDLLKLLVKAGKEAKYIPDFEAAASYLIQNVQPKDIVVTVGLGTVCEVGELFIEGYKRLHQGSS